MLWIQANDTLKGNVGVQKSNPETGGLQEIGLLSGFKPNKRRGAAIACVAGKLLVLFCVALNKVQHLPAQTL